MEPGSPGGSDRVSQRAMGVSLGTGVLQLVVKITAFVITGSAAVFADAAESTVHLVAVFFAFVSIRIAARPPDRDHPYGHAKIGFLSAGVEGAAILTAALLILADATTRILRGPEVQELGWGIALTAATVLMNAALGLWLIRLGRRRHQIILSSNGWHVLTDAWTSLGVILGLLLVSLTGWVYWDPVCAIVVAINIVVTGASLLKRSVLGLMDTAGAGEIARAEAFLEAQLRDSGVSYHALRMRHRGDRMAIDFHLVFDDDTTIDEAHAFATDLERKLASAFTPEAHVLTHLEPRRNRKQHHGALGDD
jgi:cation diffusion facilitator family transporter